ncbi:MAG: UDP-N-acetylmuramate--L-alanine ligase [Anaerolineae bacterium]|jgi:UDP-N-acetylmuramate--alanine ligase
MNLLFPGAHVHLIGIGGIGMSAIGRVLRGWGYTVSGSDWQASELTRALDAEGLIVYLGHDAGHVAGADIVVMSSAIAEDNVEVVQARQQGLPVVKREAFLAELTAGRKVIAVAGTHGKTTTSAMIAWILLQAGADPTFIVGGVLQNLGTNARAGNGPYFVIEADEYDRAFLGLEPATAVITALEHDHPDSYPTFDEMRGAFAAFVERLAAGGLLVVCGEDQEALALADRPPARQRIATYGLSAKRNWWARAVELGATAAFEVWHGDMQCGTCALQLPGQHNVLNALAALAATGDAGVAFGTAAAALTRFQGTARRFQVKGQARGVTVVDDYAHHPTEIEVTLEAARLKFPGRRLWAVFQPHTYSRTAALLEDFASAFVAADRVLVTEIYAARETDTLDVSGADLVGHMDHAAARYVSTLEEAAALLAKEVSAGDVVLTMGAGDGYLIGEKLLAELARQEKGE